MGGTERGQGRLRRRFAGVAAGDLAAWDAFVRALVTRYRGRIEAYELWVMGNDPRFYAGTVETLVEMTRRAAQIVKTSDPAAVVACPGMGRLWTSDGQRFLDRFAALGGFTHCDVASVQLHQRSASDPPETMLALVDRLDRAFHRANAHPPLWNTGTTYDIRLQERLDQTAATNHAVRFYLTGLYAQPAGLQRMYFYNWGGTKIPLVLQAVGGAPTAAALAVEELQRWLAHATIHGCGHGVANNLPDNVWQCEFTIAGRTATADATIRWTDAGTARMTASNGLKTVHRLDGSTAELRPGDGIEIGEQPVLLCSCDP